MNEILEYHTLKKNNKNKDINLIIYDENIPNIVKKELFSKLLNNDYKLLNYINLHFNFIQDNKEILKNVTNIHSLFTIYTFLLINKYENSEMMDIIKHNIKNIINSEDVNLSYYFHDILFIYSIKENVDFKEIMKKVDSETYNEMNLKFVEDNKEYKDTFNFYFNINNIDLTDEKIAEFFSERTTTSSSMKFLDENKLLFLKLLNLNNKNYNELKIILNKYSSSYIENNYFKITSNVSQENFIDFYKYKKKMELYIEKSYVKYDEYGEKDDYNDYEKSYKLDFSKNKKLSDIEKIKLLDFSLSKKHYFKDVYKTQLFDVLINIKKLEELKEYKNIINFCIEIFNEQHLNYNELINSYYSRVSKNIDMIIIIDKLRDEYFNHELYKYYENLSLTENKEYLLLNIADKIFNKNDFKTLFNNFLGIEKFYNFNKLSRYTNYGDTYNDFYKISNNNLIHEIIIDEFIEKEEFLKLIEMDSTFRLNDVNTNKINYFLIQNVDEIIKYDKINKYAILLKEKNIINNEIFENAFVNIIFDDNMDYLYLVENIEKFINRFKPHEQFKIRFHFYNNKKLFDGDYLSPEQKEKLLPLFMDESIFELLSNFKFDILTKQEIIKLIVHEDEDEDEDEFFDDESDKYKKQNIKFIKNMNDYFKSVEITSIIFNICDILDISINPDIKKEFYHMMITDIEEVFTI